MFVYILHAPFRAGLGFRSAVTLMETSAVENGWTNEVHNNPLSSHTYCRSILCCFGSLPEDWPKPLLLHFWLCAFQAYPFTPYPALKKSKTLHLHNIDTDVTYECIPLKGLEPTRCCQLRPAKLKLFHYFPPLKLIDSKMFCLLCTMTACLHDSCLDYLI